MQTHVADHQIQFPPIFMPERKRIPVFGTLPDGSYPFLALPRPGRPPFVVQRDMFLNTLKLIGNRELSWEIVTEPKRIMRAEDIHVHISAFQSRVIGYKVADYDGEVVEKLVLRHCHGKRHGIIKLYNLYNSIKQSPWNDREPQNVWKRAEMRKNGRCDCYDFRRQKTCSHVERAIESQKKMSKHEKAIARIERTLERECQLPDMDGRGPWTESSPLSSETERSQRRQWHEWYLQKNARREIQRRVRGWQSCRSMNSTSKLYKIVNDVTFPQYECQNWQAAYNKSEPEQWAIRERRVTVKKWSELDNHGRRQFGNPENSRNHHGGIADGDMDVYLARLWESCGLAKKPYRDLHEPVWGAERYEYFLEQLKKRKEALSILAGLKAEAGVQ